MIFTVLGRIAAWLLLVLGVLRVATGFYVASIDDPAAKAEAMAIYIFTDTTGETIDRGMYTLLLGVVFGLLAEISASARQRPRA